MPSLRALHTRSFGGFWMSLAIYTTLSSGSVFSPAPTEGERLMLTLWGILVSHLAPSRRPAASRASANVRGCCTLRGLCRPMPAPAAPSQTFLLWLCTFHTNLVTSWLFFSLAILFWFLAGGTGTSESRTTLTKVAGGWGFMVAATAFYDGTASLMKDVYGKQILPVFPLKPVNKVSLGDFGTKRFVDPEAGKA
jgi:hypothetical protein